MILFFIFFCFYLFLSQKFLDHSLLTRVREKLCIFLLAIFLWEKTQIMIMKLTKKNDGGQRLDKYTGNIYLLFFRQTTITTSFIASYSLILPSHNVYLKNKTEQQQRQQKVIFYFLFLFLIFRRINTNKCKQTFIFWLFQN